MKREANMGQKVTGGIKTVDMRDPTYRPLKQELQGLDYCKPTRLDLLLDMPPVSYDVQLLHSWNNNDRSLNVFVKEDDKLIFHRHPVAQSTDAIRGKVGYTRGLHVWQITWAMRQRGTHAVVGWRRQMPPALCWVHDTRGEQPRVLGLGLGAQSALP